MSFSKVFVFSSCLHSTDSELGYDVLGVLDGFSPVCCQVYPEGGASGFYHALCESAYDVEAFWLRLLSVGMEIPRPPSTQVLTRMRHAIAATSAQCTESTGRTPSGLLDILQVCLRRPPVRSACISGTLCRLATKLRDACGLMPDRSYQAAVSKASSS